MMRVEVTPLSVQGKFLLSAEVKKQKISAGKLVVREKPVTVSGRRCVTASLVSATDMRAGALLPELFDADLIFAEDGVMRIHGVEQINGQFFGQTWHVKVL